MHSCLLAMHFSVETQPNQRRLMKFAWITMAGLLLLSGCSKNSSPDSATAASSEASVKDTFVSLIETSLQPGTPPPDLVEINQLKEALLAIPRGEMEEVLGLADRIIVMHEGKITGELAKSEFSEEAVMNLATGKLSPQQVSQ